MNERRQRLVLWSGVFALTLLLFIPKGHETPPGGEPSVAFLHGKPGNMTVRISGDISRPGVYMVNASDAVADLIRQSAPDLQRQSAGRGFPLTPLHDGDVVTVTRGEGASVSLAVDVMTARERLVLGVPLDPARMAAADWEALPGIGPALAERIVRYGTAHGGIHALGDLREIPGIGERTIGKLRPLFRADTQ
jgi:competence protein ComEA